MVVPMLGEGFQDRVSQRPSGGHSPWVLEEVPQRWGGTIPFLARVTEGMVARLTGGRHSGRSGLEYLLGIQEGDGQLAFARKPFIP